MSIWEKLLVALGIRSEEEIRRKTEVQRRMKEKAIERSIQRLTSDIEKSKQNAIAKEKAGNHQEALHYMNIAEAKRKARCIAEDNLLKCREAHEIMQTGEMVADAYKSANQLTEMTRKSSSPEQIIAEKEAFEINKMRIEEDVEQIQSMMDSVETDPVLAVSSDEAEAALAQLMLAYDTKDAIPVPAAVVEGKKPAELSNQEWKQEQKDRILSICADN